MLKGKKELFTRHFSMATTFDDVIYTARHTFDEQTPKVKGRKTI